MAKKSGGPNGIQSARVHGHPACGEVGCIGNDEADSGCVISKLMTSFRHRGLAVRNLIIEDQAACGRQKLGREPVSKAAA